ncbi:hypothetical protein ACIP93_33665 [Streptomyces sp. NPDC088745]|uniref:hypothetical protein n=1 Tax=Streptomyces sp. NPDC088745 TaxID=3365884 RepID=UPI003808EEE2
MTTAGTPGDDITEDPTAASAARLAEDARPAWDLYAAAHSGVCISDLISDLLHLADHLPNETGRDAEAILARARHNYDDERP